MPYSSVISPRICSGTTEGSNSLPYSRSISGSANSVSASPIGSSSALTAFSPSANPRVSSAPARASHGSIAIAIAPPMNCVASTSRNATA